MKVWETWLRMWRVNRVKKLPHKDGMGDERLQL